MALPVTDLPDDRVNILMVDDQPENLVALEAMLEGLGQHLIAARSGRDALRTLLTVDAAVILLDVKMPDMDGFETAELIRARERTRNTPIIFLTAADRSEALALRGYAVGAVDYLVKPVIPELVRSKVAVFVELARRSQQLSRQADRLRQSEQAARELADARAVLLEDLEQKTREMETFSYAVSHDLRAPLRRIDGFSRALLEAETGRLEQRSADFLQRIRQATVDMSDLIDGMLALARVARADLRVRPVDFSSIAETVAAQLHESDPARSVDVVIRPHVEGSGDPQLLRVVLQNLLDNAWKFTRTRPAAQIEFGTLHQHSDPTYFVRDNGVGFETAYADRLFKPFQRLHPAREFEGTGIGLATVHRIIQRHGGRVWAESTPGEGATFSFTLGRTRDGSG
jgi:two-component system, sensor histidine kinase and response regulator